MKQTIIFCFKLSLTAALVAPFLYLFPYEHYHGNDNESGFVFLWIPIVIIEGACCAIIHTLLLFGAVYLLQPKYMSVLTIKLGLSILIIPLVYLTFIVLNGYPGSLIADDYQLGTAYTVIAIASIWFYRLEDKNYETSTHL